MALFSGPPCEAERRLAARATVTHAYVRDSQRTSIKAPLRVSVAGRRNGLLRRASTNTAEPSVSFDVVGQKRVAGATTTHFIGLEQEHSHRLQMGLRAPQLALSLSREAVG
jgi:hypothetical protein